MNQTLISIDPATHYTGYGVYEEAKIQNSGKDFILSRFGLIRPTRQKDLWTDRARVITMKFIQLLMQIKPTLCGIEYPEFQGGDRGYTAARRGDILMIAFLCGRLCDAWDSYAISMRDPQIQPPALITPTQWKGQLPKPITVERVNEFFGLELTNGIENNIADAIGLGKHILEKVECKILEGMSNTLERVDV